MHCAVARLHLRAAAQDNPVAVACECGCTRVSCSSSARCCHPQTANVIISYIWRRPMLCAVCSHYMGRVLTLCDCTFCSLGLWCCPLQLVGRKRAPNFTQEQRPLVYRAWQQYERAKGRGWDRADLSAHLYRQLMKTGGYNGALFEAIYRCDKAKHIMHTGLVPASYHTAMDMISSASCQQRACNQCRAKSVVGSGLATGFGSVLGPTATYLGCFLSLSLLTRQAELFLDLRVSSDPNGLFYCGDTCQTIARGIGFR